MVYAGVEDAALFRSTNGGQTWNELPGLRRPRVISAAGAFCTEDGRVALRRVRIQRLLGEALEQGAVASQEDLAVALKCGRAHHQTGLQSAGSLTSPHPGNHFQIKN